MKKRLFICALICGSLCALCVFLYTEMVYNEADSKRNEALMRYGGEQVDVLIATRDIHPGEALSPSNCQSKTWLSDLLPQNAILALDEVNGKQATSLILQGEVVSSSRFNNETQELNIPAGFVAIALPAQDVQAVGGNLSPGSKVNVYATGNSTSCLGTGIEVLATSAGTDEASSSSRITWVTLAVRPEKAQEFVAASQSMEIYFTLPSANQTKTANNTSAETGNKTEKKNEKDTSATNETSQSTTQTSKS